MIFKPKTAIAFIDFQNAMLIFFIFLAGILFTQVVHLRAEGNLTQKAEIVAIIEWPDNSPDDVDLWIKDPQGQVLSYRNKAIDSMTLDQDERGINPNVMFRQEVGSIRGINPGRYAVQVILFSHLSNTEVPIKIKIMKLNPYSVVIDKTIILQNTGDKQVVVSFDLDSNGNITNINTEAQF